jgi:hypothetical protein
MSRTDDRDGEAEYRRRGRIPSRIRGALFVALAGVVTLLPAGPRAADTTGVAPDSTGEPDIAASVTLPPSGQREVLPAAQKPFRPGESLRFSVQYGFIKAGTAWLEVPEIREWNSRPVYALVARAESNAFFSRFYKVRNRIESMWDVEGRFSWRYYEKRREGGYRTESEIVFDPSRGEARYSNGTVYPVPPQVQDALSSFYYTRFQALPLGGSVIFDYHASRKSQPLEVKVLGRERVQTPAGTFDCVAIEPVLKAGGIFKNKGRLVIWITDDERRMPVLMRSKVLVGSISVVLQEVRAGA